MPRHATLSRLELRIMEALWTRGACSVREMHEALPEKGKPAFTTVQTMVYRLEKKQALRCVKRIGNANIFEALISRDEAHTTLIDDLLQLFDDRAKPVMARLVESGRLTLEDIKEAEEALKKITVRLSRNQRKTGSPALGGGPDGPAASSDTNAAACQKDELQRVSVTKKGRSR